jgi:hypothetical protein
MIERAAGVQLRWVGPLPQLPRDPHLGGRLQHYSSTGSAAPAQDWGEPPLGSLATQWCITLDTAASQHIDLSPHNRRHSQLQRSLQVATRAAACAGTAPASS